MTHSRIIGHPIASNKEVDVIGTQKSKKKQRKLYNKSVCFFLFFFLNFILATCFVCLHWTNVHTMETSLSRHITITSSGREKKKDWKLISIGWQQHRKEDDALMIEDVISFYKRKKNGCWNRVKTYPSLFNGRQTMKICYAGQHIYDLALVSWRCASTPIFVYCRLYKYFRAAQKGTHMSCSLM